MTIDELKQAQAADEYASLRAAFNAGARIQAWHLNEGATSSNDGRWDTVGAPGGPVEYVPEFGCAPHLYRVHPDDIALLPFDSGLVRDAERYRWMRGYATPCHLNINYADVLIQLSHNGGLDAAIDAAIHAQAGGSES